VTALHIFKKWKKKT